jgi:hypothetical protein
MWNSLARLGVSRCFKSFISRNVCTGKLRARFLRNVPEDSPSINIMIARAHGEFDATVFGEK